MSESKKQKPRVTPRTTKTDPPISQQTTSTRSRDNINVNTSIRTEKKEPLIPQQTAPLCSKDNVDIDGYVINAATEILPDDTPSATQPMASVNTTNVLPTTIVSLTTPNTPNLNNSTQNKNSKNCIWKSSDNYRLCTQPFTLQKEQKEHDWLFHAGTTNRCNYNTICTLLLQK